jgi:plasmid maintenance system antidote protein VapI
MLQQVRKPRRFRASERLWMNLQAHYDLEIRRD